MMTQAQQQYLQIIKTVLWNRPCDCIVTDEIFDIAVQQSTTGLISRISDDDRCQDRLVMLLWAHSNTNEVLQDVVDFLKENGIRCVLLKGQGCAANYPNPALRDCGDIDLYVGEENYLQTCTLLEHSPLGAVMGPECDHHKQFTVNGVILEIHHSCLKLDNHHLQPLFDRMSVEGLTENLRTVDVNGYEVCVPEDNFNVLYVFMHMFHHFINGGIGCRQMCDWVMLLHARKDALDLTKLQSMTKSLGLLDNWRLFGYVAVNHFGLPQEEMPFYKDNYSHRADLVLERMFKCGNFGKYGRDNDVVNKIRNPWLRKPAAFFLYTFSFFKKRYILGPSLPYSMLFEMYAIGFRETFRKKNKN